MTLNKILSGIDKENIIHLYKDGEKEISSLLGISKLFVNDVISKYQFVQDKWCELLEENY